MENKRRNNVLMSEEAYDRLKEENNTLKNMIRELIELNNEERKLKRSHKAFLHIRDYISVVIMSDKIKLETMENEGKEMPPVIVMEDECMCLNCPYTEEVPEVSEEEPCKEEECRKGNSAPDMMDPNWFSILFVNSDTLFRFLVDGTK